LPTWNALCLRPIPTPCDHDTMKAHILQHVPFEGPAWIGQWLMARGA
jgi:hypothetical protein